MKIFKVRLKKGYGDGSLKDKKDFEYVYMSVKAKSLKKAKEYINTKTHCRTYDH